MFGQFIVSSFIRSVVDIEQTKPMYLDGIIPKLLAVKYLFANSIPLKRCTNIIAYLDRHRATSYCSCASAGPS